ncbi:hypothetical protein SAMN05216388_100789 [Halorientalis persicus]|uniref:Uncharacterized protein n=1 Tax=Halorientalis persicus TaxID=1367881 RepID=A0A1H8LDI8_9EURY|nr:hypothetical protein [Halorientalis persicus]SEO02788.1 hypothetical protein SAMN05216388_100789 [Halorientalis persicus]
MSLERTTHLLVGVLLAVAFLTVSSVAVAGVTAAELEQTTNETADTTTANDSTANATLGNLTVWTAPGDDFANLTSPAAVQAAKREGWLTRSRTVAEDDTVVFGLPAPGLVEAVTEANDTESDAAAFLAVLGRSDTDEFRMELTTGMGRKELDLSATLAADGLRVVPDERSGTLYVALRTERAVLDYGGDRERSFEDGEDYRVNLTLTSGNATTSSEVEWGIVERRLAFEESGEPVVVRLGQPCTVVSGETAAAPGTDIEVRLRSTETHRLQATARATVGPSGEFATCLDTTGVDRDTTFHLGAATFNDDYDHPVRHNASAPPATPDGDPAVWIAPTERFGDLTSPAAVDDGKQYGWLTRNRTVAVNDTAVFAVRAPELTTQIELSRGNASATERFVELVNRSSVYHFRMEQTEDTTLTELDEKELNLSMTLARGATRVVPDEHNGTLYVALRTDLVALDFGSLRGEPPAGGEDYRVNVTVGTGPTANTSAVRVSAVDRTVTFDDERSAGIVVDDLGQQCTRLSGRTSVAPGTSVRVDLRSRNGTVRTTHATTVNRSGRFSVCADTTGIPDDAVLDLRIDEAPDFEGVLIENRTGLLDVSVRAVTDDEIEIGGIFRNTTGFVALYAAPEAATALTDPARPPNCAQSAINRTVANWTHLAVGDFDWSGYGYAELDRPSIADDRALIAVAHRNRDGKFDFEAPTTDPPVCRDGALVGTVVNLQGPPSANDTEGSDRIGPPSRRRP